MIRLETLIELKFLNSSFLDPLRRPVGIRIEQIVRNGTIQRIDPNPEVTGPALSGRAAGIIIIIVTTTTIIIIIIIIITIIMLLLLLLLLLL